jgi:hypothetical protein
MPLMFKPRAPVYDPKAGPVVFVVLLRGVQSQFYENPGWAAFPPETEAMRSTVQIIGQSYSFNSLFSVRSAMEIIMSRETTAPDPLSRNARRVIQSGSQRGK